LLTPLAAKKKRYEVFNYQFDLCVEVLQVDVMADFHVLKLHLKVLIRFEMFKTVSPLEDSLRQGFTQG